MNSYRFAALGVVCLSATLVHGADRPAKNVVLMVADGAGFNTWKATAMYEGSVGKDFHDAPGWVKLAASTHPLRQGAAPAVSVELGQTQIPSLVYDPVRAWNTTPVEGGRRQFPYHFEGYRWLRQTSPDSAGTMSTMVTGVKTYSGSINVDGRGQPIEQTIAKLAHDQGKRVGVATSVQLTHATPAAAAGAHHFYRSAYCEIAVEVLTGSYPDVLAGCGHPDFDHAGDPYEDDAAKDYDYVGGQAIWDFLTRAGRLEAGQQVCVREVAGQPQGIRLNGGQIADLERWTLRQSRAEIEALAEGSTPDRLLIVPRIGGTGFWSGVAPSPDDPYAVWLGGTLQQQRGSRADRKYTAPGYDPLIETVPSLEMLTRVALNALDDGDGFFLHVEGGAVDWAMHGNQLGRMIEEMQDFKRSIETVVSWIEGHGGWDETLLIVTADHDHMLWGPNADSIPFDPLVDNGAGKMPSYRWLDHSHSNALVPLFARGAGAETFRTRAGGTDPFYGKYVDQTDVFEVMKTAFAPPGQ